ncbi:hypothetical protein C5167_005730 [Papaver somniferum]|uniref:Uncharacterized protein n=1 Tax=Papaver somniferum TaxID=3469 RepID=A0A4Y7JF98_PAPSO|nr:hypothetical protein C5167_005730 [Papaver somniferum]
MEDRLDISQVSPRYWYLVRRSTIYPDHRSFCMLPNPFLSSFMKLLYGTVIRSMLYIFWVSATGGEVECLYELFGGGLRHLSIKRNVVRCRCRNFFGNALIPYKGFTDAHALWMPPTYLWWSFIKDSAKLTSNFINKCTEKLKMTEVQCCATTGVRYLALVLLLLIRQSAQDSIAMQGPLWMD